MEDVLFELAMIGVLLFAIFGVFKLIELIISLI